MTRRDDETTFEFAEAVAVDDQSGAYLAVVAGQQSEVINLYKRRDLTIGRSRSCDLVLADPGSSRLHATIRWDGDNLVALTDHQSRNGTFADGVRVQGTVRLVSGSEIQIGSIHIIVAVPNNETSSFMTTSLGLDEIIAKARGTREVLALSSKAARSDVGVLIQGETGVGKEVMARFIHERSRRGAERFVAVNCASIPEQLAESQLFGHERGAFTGAHGRHQGVFEQAHGGTLFLDEVGELSPSTQARLLRVVQERVVTRVGSIEPTPVDVRIIAATHRHLHAMVEAGTFRQDLLYRLDVLQIHIPPLRERREDIMPLAEQMLDELSEEPKSLSAAARRTLLEHSWPGNVRELRNVIEKAVAISDGPVLSARHVAPATPPVHAARPEGASYANATRPLDGSNVATSNAEQLQSAVDAAEEKAIREAYARCDGNQSKTARDLGISRRALIYKLEKYGLKQKPKPRS